jgi:hypothetical protein
MAVFLEIKFSFVEKDPSLRYRILAIAIGKKGIYDWGLWTTKRPLASCKRPF